MSIREKYIGKVMMISSTMPRNNEIILLGTAMCDGVTEDEKHFRFCSTSCETRHPGYPKRKDMDLGSIHTRRRDEVVLSANDIRDMIHSGITKTGKSDYYIVYDRYTLRLLPAKAITDPYTDNVKYRTIGVVDMEFDRFGDNYYVYDNLDDAVDKVIEICSPYFCDKTAENTAETDLNDMQTTVNVNTADIEALIRATGINITDENTLRKAIFAAIEKVTSHKMVG